jgi:hypothetical protein
METINKYTRILQNRFMLLIYLIDNQSSGPLHATAFFGVLAVRFWADVLSKLEYTIQSIEFIFFIRFLVFISDIQQSFPIIFIIYEITLIRRL